MITTREQQAVEFRLGQRAFLGKPFDLELHLVHRSSAGALAVVGVFVKPVQANTALQPIWNAMPREEAPDRAAGESIDPAALFANNARPVQAPNRRFLLQTF